MSGAGLTSSQMEGLQLSAGPEQDKETPVTPEPVGAPAASETESKTDCKQSEEKEKQNDVELNESLDLSEQRPREHTVSDRETVARIAAMYDVTPSELAQTNKLGMSRMVFPGQVLRIPSPPPPPPTPPDPPIEEMEIIEYQFIKLRVRHITSGRGVVGGSVLFTPNAVIFDPDPKDPLVEELEPEAFQIIAPMEFVVNAAIFLDFFPIGSTGKTMGREHPPSELFTRPPKSSGLARGEGGESGYSLCEELRTESETQNGTKCEEQARSDPYYLRLTMGKPVNREVARSTPTMAYGVQTMMPEYWFIVPSHQVLNLYNFLDCWFPEIYGSFDLEEVHEMGFELVPEPVLDQVAHETDGLGSLNTASCTRMIRKTMTLNSIDIDFLLPEMEPVPSVLVSDDQRKLLYRHLPPRVQGYTWTRIFSTAQDGFSLHSLYRKAGQVDSPVLTIIQDTDHAVFGALTSCAPVMSDNFQGTGESWLFTFFPSFKVYSWTGENNFIVRGGQDNLVIGSSQGGFGLWLDEDFNSGRSQAVSTFQNKPLPGKEDFTVNNIECWAFVM